MVPIGDITERMIRLFGITKQRVQAVTGREDCGCAKRQEAMNQWGYRWQYRLLWPCYWLREKWLRAIHGTVGMRLWMAGRYFRMGFRVLLYGR